MEPSKEEIYAAYAIISHAVDQKAKLVNANNKSEIIKLAKVATINKKVEEVGRFLGCIR